MVKKGPCLHCRINATPLWRNGPADKPVLCNACGSRYKAKGHLNNYRPKIVYPQSHNKSFQNVDGESPLNVEDPHANHVPPSTTSNGDNNKSLPYVHHISAQGGVNSDFEKKIPTRKRSPVVYKQMTPMEKFQKELLSLYRSEKQPEESLLVDNVNKFIPENEIGLGVILLKTDDDASTFSSTYKCESSTTTL